ncbi:DEAD/DEAH box helicase [uncultured Thiohalocapsa sp.]|uniref:DEAD/DEAH box helicase n=1 Tax=uncultured Thiohalocapsa sp. TaxID=768990 RepID=UPI0025F47F44|nr:DEAD/DEAH box helicase [uncultured Thiohalocapsa sp.]
MSFENLGLAAELLRAVREQGYTEPTPIQRQAIPTILTGADVLAGAQTGTGKTAGFTLPLLQRLMASCPPGAARRGQRPIRALVLTPTRELAAQVQDSVETYGRHLPLTSAVIFGGVKINPQIAQLRRGVDVLVATPGRLLDHAGQGTVDLSRIEILVLDEADRMLDMGFIHDIRRVLALLPDKHRRQNLLFSATFSDEIKDLANRLLNSPQLIEVARRNTAAETVRQTVHPVDRHRKRELLSHLVGANDWRQVLVFTRTKHGANRLAEQLEKDGLTAAAIHGNKSQGARTRALAGFKTGDVRVLVATDIAARGLDIDQLPHVVNFELPNVPEDYVHRIGRTGRAGNAGEAISLVCVDEHKLLRDIERLLGRPVPQVVLDGYAPDPSIPAEPILRGKGGRRGQGDDRATDGARRGGQRRGAGRSEAGPRKARSPADPAGAPGGRQRHHSAAADSRVGDTGRSAPPAKRSQKPGHVHRNPQAAAGTQPERGHRHNRSGRRREVPALLGGRED